MSRRSLQQNALLWSRLSDLASQVPWCVNGKMQHITPEDFKDVLTAGLKKEQRVAMGIDGGFVILGARTSKMKVGEFKELLDFAEYFGNTREPPVIWTIGTSSNTG